MIFIGVVFAAYVVTMVLLYIVDIRTGLINSERMAPVMAVVMPSGAGLGALLAAVF